MHRIGSLNERMVNFSKCVVISAAGLSMLNAGPNVNTSLSQIPLPDGSSNLATVTSGMSLNNDFKPPPFGLTPPMLFPGM